jgi:signal transduction histidine kinase
MGLRHKSIRLRVLLLILVPLLSLLGVYAFATTQTARQAIDLAHAGQVANVSVAPTSALITAVAAERSAAVLYLAVPTPKGLAALTKAEGATNKAVKRFEGASMSGPVAAGASELDKVDTQQLIKASAQLAGLRTSVTARGLTLLDAINQYSAIVNLGNTVIQQEIQKANIAVPIVTTAEQQTYFYESAEIALQESDLYVSSVISGSFTPAARAEFAQLVGTRRYLVATSVPQLDAASHALYVKYVTPQLSQGLEQVENEVLSRQPPRGVPPVAPAVWGQGVAPYAKAAGKMLKAGTAAIVAQVRSNAESTLLTLILAAGLGLAAIIFSIIFSILVGRGLISQLKGLRLSALELANDRLPSVIRRLRDGENVDVAAETPALEAGTAEAPRSSDEIDQVQEAFNIVQRTAIEAAVDEANLRRGVSDVFRNLARRSQVLLHRQLRLLDGMERRASEPEELEDLFRIDHLTTRMRRHAEGLIILSGEPAGRTWRHPVPLMDVLRAAVAEVEDYTRIRVEARTRAALAGTAVADVIHLIAELAENATVFSPPNTPVKISGDIVGRGFAVEIEDRGLGITEERLAEINKNLADPPAFDLSGSDRLGLFIAGRLARRHDIRITLRPSVYGGTSAIVIIPMTLVVDEDNYEHVPAIGTDGNGLPLGGRHAALADGPAAVGNGSAPAAAALGRGASPSGNGSLPWSAEASPSGQAPADPSYWNSPTAVSPAAPPELAASLPLPRQPAPSLPTTGVQARVAAAGNEPVNPELDWAELVTGPQPAVTEPAPFRAGPSPSSPFGTDSLGAGNLGTDRFGVPGLEPRASAPAEPGDFGLPTRVRQASIAPQLRQPTPPDVLPSRGSGLPSPDAARNTMAALQRGWQLGRSAADEPSAPDAGLPPAADND